MSCRLRVAHFPRPCPCIHCTPDCPFGFRCLCPDGAASVFPRPEKVREDACPEARVKHNRACSPRRQPQEKTPPDFSAGLSGLTSEFSLCSWVSALPRLLRSTKTPFSQFMLSTLPLCRDSSLAVSSALFPLPVPCPGLFRQQARCSSSRAYLRLCQRKCVHFAIVALNYLRAGCKHVSLEGLRRPPSPIQVQAYARTATQAPPRPAQVGKDCIQPRGCRRSLLS